MTAMETPKQAAERQARRKALRKRMIQARNALTPEEREALADEPAGE